MCCWKAVAVLEPNGDVKACELLPKIGNIREFNYDLKKVLASSSARKLREFIKKGDCFCTHCVFILESLEYNLPHYIKKVLLK